MHACAGGTRGPGAAQCARVRGGHAQIEKCNQAVSDADMMAEEAEQALQHAGPLRRFAEKYQKLIGEDVQVRLKVVHGVLRWGAAAAADGTSWGVLAVAAAAVKNPLHFAGRTSSVHARTNTHAPTNTHTNTRAARRRNFRDMYEPCVFT